MGGGLTALLLIHIRVARSAHWSAVNSYSNMSGRLHRSNSHRSTLHANYVKRNPPLSYFLTLSPCLPLSLAQFALILSRALCVCLSFHLHTLWNCFCRTFNSLILGRTYLVTLISLCFYFIRLFLSLSNSCDLQ